MRPAILSRSAISHFGYHSRTSDTACLRSTRSRYNAKLERVIIAPHARFAGRNLAALRNRVPAVRPMIHGVQHQSLVIRVGAQIRLGEQRVGRPSGRPASNDPSSDSGPAAAVPARRWPRPNCPPARGDCTDRRVWRASRRASPGPARRCPNTGCRRAACSRCRNRRWLGGLPHHRNDFGLPPMLSARLRRVRRTPTARRSRTSPTPVRASRC